MSAARADEPALSEVLEALADAGPLDAAAARLGLTPQRLSAYLLETAAAVAFRTPSTTREKPRPPVSAPLPERPGDRSIQPADRPAHPTPSTPSPAPGRLAILEVFSDGAARGNPGPAGAGSVVRTMDGQIIARLGKFLGRQTNNVAEYEGLLLGLRKALELGAKEVRVFADSMLVINQLRGEWKIKHPGLKPYFTEARVLLGKFDRSSLQHIRRELNGEADEMSNRAIDEKM